MDSHCRHIDVLLFDGINLLDIAGPIQAFKEAGEPDGAGYRTRFVSMNGESVLSCSGLRLQADAPASLGSDATDIVVPGGKGVDAALDSAALSSLLRNWQTTRKNARLISICSGALLLANAGVLDGCEATTHWSREQQALRDFPAVHWRINQLYTQNNSTFTSAGVTAGIDLALSIILNDHGRHCALSVARELVVYLKRSGGQPQYSPLLHSQFSTETGCEKLIDAIVERPADDWTLNRMADYMGMTPRTLTRKFQSAINTSPVRFLEQTRVRLSSELLGSGLPLARIAERTGFGDLQRMQRAYKRQLGSTLGEYVKSQGC